MTRPRKPGTPHKGWKAAAVKTKAKPVSSAEESAHWAAVVEALKTKKVAPRRPRGE